jgi:hypothetical protein
MQCDTERLGRVMTLMKPPDRASLGSLHFKQSVSVNYNSPSVSSFGFDRLAKLFLKEHLPPIQFDERRSGVKDKEIIRRLQSVKKHTFMA